MSGDAYSPLKAVRHLDIVQGVRQEKPVRPAHVQLIISDTCNQSCHFCFGPDAMVLTSDGYKRIAEIEQGALVLDSEGLFQHVTRVMSRQYDGEMVSLKLRKLGTGIKATPEHPVEVMRDGRRQFIPIADVRPADRLVVPMARHHGATATDIDLTELIDGLDYDATHVWFKRSKKLIKRFLPVGASLGRWLGYFVGDGHVSTLTNRPNSANVCVTFHRDETHHIEDLARLTDELFGIGVGANPVGSIHQVIIASNVVGAFARAVCATGSHDKQLNPLLWTYADREFIEGFLTGYAYSDGCIDDASFSTVSKALAYSVFQAAVRVGWSPMVAVSPPRPSRIKGRVLHSRGDRYMLRMRGESRRMFRALVGVPAPPVAGPGGREEVFERAEHAVLVPVSEVKREPYSGPVYNLEVENSHTYTVEMLSVHNCSYRTPGYSSSQMFYQIDPAISRGGLRRDAAHPERNYNPQRMIPWEKIAEIIDDCAEMKVSGLQFTGGGEPTVHARFLDAVRYVRDKGIAYSLVSNGVLISARSMAEELATASWVRVSVDAGKAATYAKIRGVPASHWDHAWSAIRELRNARDKQGTGCTIGAGFVVTPDNWREVLLFAQCAKAAGADNVRISAQFSNENEKPFAEFYDSCSLLCRDAEELTGDGFTVYNRFGAKLEELRLKRPTTPFCGYQQFTTYIGADLNVYRCCVLSYNKKGIVGSLKDQRFRDLWLSQERMDGMMGFDARSCDRCQFTTINKHLDYVLAADEPLHSEFV